MAQIQLKDRLQFSLPIRPVSYNSNNRKARDVYNKKLRSTFHRLYTGSFPSEDLYASILYFYNEDVNLDADNLSKPVWDALTGHAFIDDKQIKVRCAASIDVSSCAFVIDDVPILDYDLINSILGNDHTILIEVGKINDIMNLFKMNDIWK